MVLPVVYRTGGESAAATYDFMDLADGSGVVTLYGGIDQSAAGVLSRNQFYSDVI